MERKSGKQRIVPLPMTFPVGAAHIRGMRTSHLLILIYLQACVQMSVTIAEVCYPIDTNGLTDVGDWPEVVQAVRDACSYVACARQLLATRVRNFVNR